MKTPLQLTGIGLRKQHHAELIEKKPSIAWVEVCSENFFAEGGQAIQQLDVVRKHYPVSLHGVGLSLGSYDELNWQHLHHLKILVDRVEPCLISEHLSWSSINGRYLNDLLPLPYTDEAINHLVRRIQQVQDYLKREILIENITSYVNYDQSTMPEYTFISQIAKRAGCGILLDVNSLYINSINLQMDITAYLNALPNELVKQIHLSGYTATMIDDQELLIDSHNKPVASSVWDLYRRVVKKIGRKPTLIEWDSNLPSLDLLCLEARKAENILKESYVTTECTS